MHNTVIYISSKKKKLDMLIKTEMKKAFRITLLLDIGTSSKFHLQTIEKTLIHLKVNNRETTMDINSINLCIISQELNWNHQIKW